MSRRALVTALALVCLGPALARARTVRWTMADEYPATSIQGEADARFAREAARRSGGRVVIDHQHDARSGFRSKDIVGAIARGAVPSLPFLAGTPMEGQALAVVGRHAYAATLARPVEDWKRTMGPAAGPLLDAYRRAARLAATSQGGK
jgi:hypothetical protein